MPSISYDSSKHVIIARRKGEYLCFPDVCRTASGRLICAYNAYDQHVAKWRRLVVVTSDDEGRTWSEPQLLALYNSHCPRLTVLPGGEVQLLDANGTVTYVSLDEGRSWTDRATNLNNEHAVADRPLLLDDNTLLTTAHAHRGSAAVPLTRQAPCEQMVFQSADLGANYTPRSVLYSGKRLALCEGSMCLLPDGRIAALMRENAGVFEPMYLCLSEDQGQSWTEPQPTPLVGHRPTMNVTLDGDLLVTYRDVGPNGGTAAWLGTLEELLGPYLVHGVAPHATSLTAQGMHVPKDQDTPARWALRPMTDPATATAVIECDVQVFDDPSDQPCGIYMGSWWQIFPDHIKLELPSKDGQGTPKTLRRNLPVGQVNAVRLSYAAGLVTLHVNGRKRAQVAFDPLKAATRIMAFGSMGSGSSEQLWQRVSQRISEPRFVREYEWQWDHGQGLPQTAKEHAVLELDNDRLARYPDFGYSGWCELPGGRFFCVYHHAGATNDEAEKDAYRPGKTAHVRGAWFTKDDFR